MFISGLSPHISTHGGRPLPTRHGFAIGTAALLALTTGVLTPLAGTAGATARGPIVPTAVTTETFSYTGAAQSWTVPSGVTSIDVVVKGAQGGDNKIGASLTQYGGKGGATSATLTVTPGTQLNIYVGGEGSTASAGAVGAGGYNGGGNSGLTSLTGTGSYRYSGGGGGASDIRIGGTALTDRVVVAGGGGGSARLAGGTGGQNGGNAGADGTEGNAYGRGGTASAGGDGGKGKTSGGTACVTGPDGANGADGVGGVGGDAGTVVTDAVMGGAGGGGGYFGGGGGGGGCSTNLAAGAGGGGSGYAIPGATNVTFTSGNREGNGLVTISYTQSEPEPEPEMDASVSGRTLSGSGSAFPANSAVTLTIGGITVGTVITDGDGAFVFELADVDCAVTTGTLTATSGEATATVEFTLDQCPPDTTLPPENPSPGTESTLPNDSTTSDKTSGSSTEELPRTGAGVLPVIVTAFAMATVGASGNLFSRRRRR